MEKEPLQSVPGSLSIECNSECIMWHVKYFMMSDFQLFKVKKISDDLFEITATCTALQALKAGKAFAKFIQSLAKK